MAFLKLGFLLLATIILSCQGHMNPMDFVDDQAPPPSSKFVCPPARKIAPCYCYENARYGICNGTKVTQKHIDKFFSLVRSESGVSSSDWLYMSAFSVSETNLARINIESLSMMNFTILAFGSNPRLTTFVGPLTPKSGEPTTKSIFKAFWLAAWNNSVDDIGLTDFTTSVDPKSVKLLSLSSNKLQGTNVELIPGLAEMTDVLMVILNGNQIRKVSGSQFAKNKDLFALFLNDNGMEQLGDDAFTFEAPSGKIPLTIYLQGNKLGGPSNGDMEGPSTESKISETAFSDMRQQANIILFKNELETITKEQFQTFLNNNKRNSLFLNFNKFICDQKLRWLKEQKSDYEKRVIGLDCQNDRGRTAFNSKKV